MGVVRGDWNVGHLLAQSGHGEARAPTTANRNRYYLNVEEGAKEERQKKGPRRNGGKRDEGEVEEERRSDGSRGEGEAEEETKEEQKEEQKKWRRRGRGRTDPTEDANCKT